MFAPLRWALHDLRKFMLLTPEKRQLYLQRPDADFTRHRSLSFARTAVLVLGLLKKA